MIQIIIKLTQLVCSLALLNISKEEFKFWLKGGSPGGTKMTKIHNFCHICTKTKNVVLYLLHIMIKNPQLVCPRLLKHICAENVGGENRGAAQGALKCPKMTFFSIFWEKNEKIFV